MSAASTQTSRLLRMELKDHAPGTNGMVALSFEDRENPVVLEVRNGRKVKLALTEDQLEDLRWAIVTHQADVRNGRTK